MTPRHKISSIIVTYNSAGTISLALEALQPGYAEGILDCTVIDNASTDNTVTKIELEHPWVHVVRNEINLGFGGACNIGVQLTSSEYILFLNPDAVISIHNLLKMAKFIEKCPKAGIVGPSIVEMSGALQKIYDPPTPLKLIYWASGLVKRKCSTVDHGDPPRKVSWLCGAVLLTKRSIFEKLGGFDRRFFLYFEETDLCKRAIESGFDLYALGEAESYHIAGASAVSLCDTLLGKEVTKHFYQSRFYYMCKHYGHLLAAVGEIGELVLLSIRWLGKRLVRRADNLLPIRLKAPVCQLPPKEKNEN